MLVIKKNGQKEEFNAVKIVNAISIAAERAHTELSIEDCNIVVELVQLALKGVDEIHVFDMHEIVMMALYEVSPRAYEEYRAYRNYKQRFNTAFREQIEFSKTVVLEGDKENANKDSALDSTKMQLIAEDSMKQMMIHYEMKPRWIEAHQKRWIHIHDLGSRYLHQQNCCIFDMGNLLKGGFELNGVKYLEPNSVGAALDVMGDAILSASSCQYGGFSVPRVDEFLAPYVMKSKSKWINVAQEFGLDINQVVPFVEKMVANEVKQGIQAVETKLNTINNALGQTAFVTWTFGLGTSSESRLIQKTIIQNRIDGLGQNKLTAVFPKLVYIHRKEINGAPDSPNYDIKMMALDCSLKRIYPDWLSIDSGYLAEMYEESGEVISPMGCRAFLSPYRDSEGKLVFEGRGNLGAVSLNLPKMAIESKGDINKFFELIDKYMEMIAEIHEWTYIKVGKKYGSSNPLMFCEGGGWKSVGYDERIEPILEAYTASFGYIGIEEVCRFFFGDGMINHQDFAIGVVQHIQDKIDELKSEYNRLFALYSTPAESLIYKFQKANREEYGIIKNVTDKEYMTNSFHVHVTEPVGLIQKQLLEIPMFNIAKGGRIMYNEFPTTVNKLACLQSLNHAMSIGAYYGINTQNDTCCECGYQDDFKGGDCPVCGSKEVTSINRVCGYLSYEKIKGDTRYNAGKLAEVKDRVDHC